MALFSGLEPGALERLAGLSRVLRLGRKQTLFREGEPYRGMFVVLSGLAVVFKPSGGRMLILHVCRPGDTLAETPLFEPGATRYPAQGRTTRDSEILFLPREPFSAFLQRHPVVAWRMLGDLAAKMQEMSLRLEGVTLREVTSRLAHYLLREIEAADAAGGDDPVLTLPLTKGTIASYLGTAHETLSRTFKRLIRDKVIAVDGPRITILDRSKLRRLL